MKKKNGFTLVELVTVILILGIIALIAIPVTSVQLKNSRRDSFKMTCDNIFSLNEKYELVQELLGNDTECAIFDFDKDIEEATEIDGELYQPVKVLGLENTSDLKGYFKVCKGKQLVVKNDEFTCVYDANNEKLLDTTKTVEIPVLKSLEVSPSDYSVTVIAHVENDNAKYYYYKITGDDDFRKAEENTYIFKELDDDKDYIITVYVEDKNGVRSNELSVKTHTKLGYTGVPEKVKPKDNDPKNPDEEVIPYEPGEEITYDGDEYIVIKDNGDTVTLITKYNVKLDKFGNTSSWNDSTAKAYLNNDWLANRPKKQKDIQNGGIIYDESSQSYIRMVRVDELSSKIKNYSNTPFWTMTSNGNNVRYALKNADSKYTKYSLTADVSKTVYSGNAEKLAAITKTYQTNSYTQASVNLESQPTKTQVATGSSASKKELGRGLSSYKYSVLSENYNCNCETVDCDCENYSCNTTTSTVSTVYGSYCAAGSTCTANYCDGWACNGGYTQKLVGSHSCGNTYCGKKKCVDTSCNTYSYSAPGCARGVRCMTTKECGPYTHECNKYCASYCNDYADECAGWGCAAYPCAGSACAGYSTTVQTVNTTYSTKTSTCTKCKSKCQECETCVKNTDFYEATGSQVICEKYTLSDTTDVIGIRAVLTVRKKREDY